MKLSILFAFIFGVSFGQHVGGVLPDSVVALVASDADTIVIRHIQEHERYNVKNRIFYNHKILDSTSFNVSDLLFNDRTFVAAKATSKQFFVLASDRIKKVDYVSNKNGQVYSDHYNFYIVRDGRSVFRLNYSDGSERQLVDLSSYMCLTPPCNGLDDTEFIEDVFTVDDDTYLLQTSIEGDSGPSFGFVNYYSYKRKINQVTKLTPTVKDATLFPECTSRERSNFFLVSNDSKFIHMYTNRTTNECGRDIRRSWIADTDLKLVGDVLSMGEKNKWNLRAPSIAGRRYEKGIVVGYFLYTLVDDNARIVPYEFSPDLELALYATYNNRPLEERMVNQFNNLQLSILRNLLFAKHNYRFKNEFYQGYFNLYSFYNDPQKRNSRVDNVDKLLTDVDKQNLVLLRKAESALRSGKQK